MLMSEYGDTVVISTWIRAIDLIKIADQLYRDNMQYAQISVKFCENKDFCGDVRICAIPNASSEDVKEYPIIKPNSMIDVETDFFEDHY